MLELLPHLAGRSSIMQKQLLSKTKGYILLSATFGIRDIAMNIYYTESTSTGGGGTEREGDTLFYH